MIFQGKTTLTPYHDLTISKTKDDAESRIIIIINSDIRLLPSPHMNHMNMALWLWELYTYMNMYTRHTFHYEFLVSGCNHKP